MPAPTARAELFDAVAGDPRPGSSGAWLDDYARMLGITESRRLVGDHVLTKEEGDVASPTPSPAPAIGPGATSSSTSRCARSTTPAVANLLVAGRCISTTRYVHQATKEIPGGDGHRRGRGRRGRSGRSRWAHDVHDVDIAALRADLAAAGAIV